MKKLHILIILLLVAIGIAGCTTETVNKDTELNDGSPAEVGDAMEESHDSDDSMEDDSDGAMMETTKTFVLTGEDFKFVMDGVDAPDITVQEGDTVRIEFSSTNGFHDWVVDEFNAATEKVQTDGSTFVEFVADKKGTFEYYCSVGQHRANGMIGSLIVE